MRFLIAAFCSLLFFSATAQTKIDSIKLVKDALSLYDLSFTDAEVDSMLDGLKENRDIYYAMHKLYPPNNLVYPFAFNPAIGKKIPMQKTTISWNIPANVTLPANRNELAFYSLPQLASLVKIKRSVRSN